jgi:hypothetical protein
VPRYHQLKLKYNYLKERKKTKREKSEKDRNLHIETAGKIDRREVDR